MQEARQAPADRAALRGACPAVKMYGRLASVPAKPAMPAAFADSTLSASWQRQASQCSVAVTAIVTVTVKCTLKYTVIVLVAVIVMATIAGTCVKMKTMSPCVSQPSWLLHIALLGSGNVTMSAGYATMHDVDQQGA